MKDFLPSGSSLDILKLDINDSLALKGNEYLLRSCIKYLTIYELSLAPTSLQKGYQIFLEEEIEDMLWNFPILGYAAQYWMGHWVKMENLGVPQSL